jgi:D-alanine--poly(phosphoribitol) ligase subunit 1
MLNISDICKTGIFTIYLFFYFRTMLEKLHLSIISNSEEPAFFIDGKLFTYRDVNYLVAAIQQILLKEFDATERIGIIVNDDIDTYSCIIACLLSGFTYVPIEPGHPDERNNSIIQQAALNFILCSSTQLISPSFFAMHQSRIILCGNLDPNTAGHTINKVKEESLAYILFTSGTTGFPKGVPISRKNLDSFLVSVFHDDPAIGKGDRFLQIFDLTFDLSIYSYLVPLIAGACVYTVPKNQVKYSYAISLLQEQKLTHVLSVPSFISFLRPYFREISLPSVKKWLFCGEALPEELVIEWQHCIPEARISNVYGPTEATIFCTAYPCSGFSGIKSYNGIICIGKPFKDVELIIIGEDQTEVKQGSIGELCISGSQTTKGYINNEEKNKSVFLSYKLDGESKFFYRTGDLCFKDEDGDYFFVGRTDSQVKIQGYRVELGEIENHSLAFEEVDEAVVVQKSNKQGVNNIYLFVKPAIEDKRRLMDFLRMRLPEYMLPKSIYSLNSFPLNLNGKIDRNVLKEMID